MEGNNDLATVAGLEVGCDRFYVTANQQYCNNSSPRAGIFLAGAATGPKAIMESITDGRSAASEILAFSVQQQALTHSNGHSNGHNATAEQSTALITR
jgi:heterodisulfide reductase subunit A